MAVVLGGCHMAAEKRMQLPHPWGRRGAQSWVCWCQASQVSPAGAKSAYISSNELTLRGLCLPRHGATCILPFPATSWGPGAGGTGMEADSVGKSPEPTSDPRSVSPCMSSLCCPVCGNWELSAEVGPTLLIKILLCLAYCPYLGQS